MMQSGGHKRVVSSCVPCYTKKQKCNRRYPCNHCTRRRQPEACIYNPSQALTQPEERPRVQTSMTQDDIQSQDVSCSNEPTSPRWDWSTKTTPSLGEQDASLAEFYGYVEHSATSTMSLVRKLDPSGDEDHRGDGQVPTSTLDQVERQLRRAPEREILDFLVQYYITEVHWMEQIAYTPWFLLQYQKWWTVERPKSVFDIEFAVLFLRICSYASQFLPSPSYTIDRIRGIPLGVVRDSCRDVAQKLAAICMAADGRGSLLRVQHLCILGLQWQCEGRINAFWEAISNAALVAQRIGLHRGRTAWKQGLHEFDREIRCRVFCNLYIWDSVLSRHLDSVPFLPDSFAAEHLPQMHLSPDVDDPAMPPPEGYSERLMQARLANFWRSFTQTPGSDYEATVAEERYEKFCSEYLTQLPAVLSLEPCEEWDYRLPRLPLQRQMLHIAMFESLCYNYRPLLLQNQSQMQSLPAYKRMLMTSQKRLLAAAALKVLECVSKLHALLGRSHTRWAVIIVSTFEAAVILASLAMDSQFPGAIPGEDMPSQSLNTDPLGGVKASLTRDQCLSAAQVACQRLQMLAEISNMAKAGANAVSRLIAKVPLVDVADWPSLNSFDQNALDDFLAQCSADVFPGPISPNTAIHRT